MARATVVRLRYVLSPQRKPSGTTVTVCRSPGYSRTSTVPGFEAPGAICCALVAQGEAVQELCMLPGVTVASAISSSSQWRPRAIDATNVARVSEQMGRAC
jgi:hypothetical protein